ncbi:MAG: hypothetical protein QOK47_1384 [Actinomycetota bacterium]|nr:hypothetical protein [Actinomycetota bacterium]
MSVPELERVLGLLREPEAHDDEAVPGRRLSIEQALEFRNAGNLPAEEGRTLRLVLSVEEGDPEALARKRAHFEPDYHSAPAWRRSGSKPVNVVPLGRVAPPKAGSDAWWDEPAVGALEDEWQRSGTMRGVVVPQDLRSFVHKTVLSLEAAGQEVDATSIADSVARWLSPDDAASLRDALFEANNKGAGPGPS